MRLSLNRLILVLVTVAALIAPTAISVPPAASFGGFGDVVPYKYYSDAVAWMGSNGISHGTSRGCFSPDALVTRAQAATFLYRLAGEPVGSANSPYVDVRAGWQRRPVAWLHQKGITTGVDPTHFDPDRPISRGDFATLLYRFDGSTFSGPNPYDDVTAPYQLRAIGWMSSRGITFGVTERLFAPERLITRAQVATMLWRYRGKPSASPVPEVPCRPDSPSEMFAIPSWVGVTVGAGSFGLPPSTVTQGDVVVAVEGEVFQDRVVDGCLVVDAANVTVRNVVVRCGGFRGVTVNAVSGVRLENVTVDCVGGAGKGVYLGGATNFSVDRVEITGCDDQFFIDGGVGVSSITNSVFHNQSSGVGAHTDGVQVGEFVVSSGRLDIGFNWWEYNTDGCCATAALFATNRSVLTIDVHDNYFDAGFGVHVLRCVPGSVCNVENNTLSGVPEGRFFQSVGNRGVARCNRFADGVLIPDRLYEGIKIDNTNC